MGKRRGNYSIILFSAFRSLNSDIQTIINKSEAVKKAKKEGEEKLTPKEKKELTDEEKEYKSKRKEIQEKLIKFATRVPIFMYLTDYREMSLKDVITQLEPGLFKKVTGLDVNDFELLCSLGVFNANLMNQAIFSFKRYEDSSLTYTGIDKHQNKDIGGWDTVIKRAEYERMFYNQQSTMNVEETIEEAIEHEEEPEPVREEPKHSETVVAATPIVAEPPRRHPQQGTIHTGYSVPAKQSAGLFENPSFGNGTKVKHTLFGKGTITKVYASDKKITVSFGIGEKTFVVDEKSADNAFKKGFLKVVE